MLYWIICTPVIIQTNLIFYIGVIYELETFLDLEGIKGVQPEEVIEFCKTNPKRLYYSILY